MRQRLYAPEQSRFLDRHFHSLEDGLQTGRDVRTLPDQDFVGFERRQRLLKSRILACRLGEFAA